MAFLVDSSVFIALERRNLPLGALSRLVSHEPLAMAAITASELLVGVHRASSPERRFHRQGIVEALLQAIPVLPFDLAIARIHAQLLAQLTASGQTLGSHDLLIAATALFYGQVMLTDNVREFHRVPGLEVVRSVM